MAIAWRIIDDGACAPAFNMALDEAIATAVRRDLAPPTLRLYGWKERAVSIGAFQRSRDVNIDYCRRKGIHIVRRPTGGRAVCHDDELTYSFAAKTENCPFSRGLFDSYGKISAALVRALSRIGLCPQSEARTRNRQSGKKRPEPHSPLCFQSISYGEISVGGIKIVGSAQKRWSDGLLQQGSIPLRIRPDELSHIFLCESVEEKTLAGLEQLIAAPSREGLREAIKSAFEETFEVELISSRPSPEEYALAQKLEGEKYLDDAWTFRR